MTPEELQHFDLQQKIQQYISGDMQGGERIAFEQEIRKNTGLRSEIDFSRDLVDTLKNREEMEVYHILQDIAENESIQPDFEALEKIEPKQENEEIGGEENNRPRHKTSRWKWLATASILILTITGVWYLEIGNTNKYQEAFKQYYQPENIHLEIILDDLLEAGMASVENKQKKQLATGLKQYYDQNYQIALVELLSYYKQYPKDTIAQFYLGLTYIQEGQFQKSIKLLQPLLEQELFFQDDIKWYLSLAYLKSHKQDRIKAKKILRSLIDTKKYDLKAKEILQLIQ